MRILLPQLVIMAFLLSGHLALGAERIKEDPGIQAQIDKSENTTIGSPVKQIKMEDKVPSGIKSFLNQDENTEPSQSSPKFNLDFPSTNNGITEKTRSKSSGNSLDHKIASPEKNLLDTFNIDIEFPNGWTYPGRRGGLFETIQQAQQQVAGPNGSVIYIRRGWYLPQKRTIPPFEYVGDFY